MALTEFQRQVLGTIAAKRSPSSHFGGGAALNVDRPRYSRDFDIFHQAITEVQQNADCDILALRMAGYVVAETLRSRPASGFIEAVVGRDDNTVDIQWVFDSAVRFFPVVRDDLFGWRLHDLDMAVNKTLALAGRREARDYYDIVMLAKAGMRLAALVWAAPAKDPGFTPDLLMDEISRHSSYQESELRAKIDADPFPDLVELKKVFLTEIRHARDTLPNLPMDLVGHLFLDRQGRVIDPSEIKAGDDYRAHKVCVGGSWPGFVDPSSNTSEPG